jgi:hypothetical protein
MASIIAGCVIPNVFNKLTKKRPILLSPGCPERAFFFEEGVFRDNFEVVWGSSAMAFCRTKKLQK